MTEPDTPNLWREGATVTDDQLPGLVGPHHFEQDGQFVVAWFGKKVEPEELQSLVGRPDIGGTWYPPATE